MRTTPLRFTGVFNVLLIAMLGVALASGCGDSSSQPATSCTKDDDCSDHLLCNGVETCNAGTCVRGTTVSCKAQDGCHTDGTCSEATGLCTIPAVADGTTCYDGNACNTGACVTGICIGTPIECVAEDSCHQAGTCDPSTAACTSPLQPDGTTCSDGNPCTVGDSCATGVCIGAPVVCTAADSCHQAGTCDPSTGACTSPLQPDGTTCSDGNPCTVGDSCATGVCIGAPVVCTAADSCHQGGACDPSTGACTSPLEPDGTTCSDGNACTIGDVCIMGSCAGSLVECPAVDACHQPGTCLPETGLCEPGTVIPDVPECAGG